MNSCTFFALTFEYKWKYKYSDKDLSDLFKESIMIMTLQVVLSVLIVFYSGSLNTGFDKQGKLQSAKFEIQAAYFLVNLVIHWMCMDNVTNGIKMMTHVIFNPAAFSHPVTAFWLGLLNTWLYVTI